MPKIWAVVPGALLLIIVSQSGCEAQECTTTGWFGSDCQYMCHCAVSATCDGETGDCSGGECEAGWFGPACQYESSVYTSSASWLFDDSCNDDSSVTTVSVTLGTPLPLTWIRVVFSGSDEDIQINVEYELDVESVVSTSCPSGQNAIVDDTTLDISCPTNEVVKTITLSGSGVRNLCSLYISRGRNVALKQPAVSQSSIDGITNPSQAVDGDVAAKPQEGFADFGGLCTRTEESTNPWWELSFGTTTYDTIMFVLYSRYNQKVRLERSTFRVYGKTSSEPLFNETFPEREEDKKEVYTMVPSPKLSEPVGRVRVSYDGDDLYQLEFCEVFVYGEIVCESGKYGIECQNMCNCADQSEACFVSTGGCTSGCAPGYTGEDCQTVCLSGKYGQDCAQDCSIHCTTPSECNHVDGSCDCEPGYQPPLCKDVCLSGTYGQDCAQDCSIHCTTPSECDHVDGSCDCEPGYQPNLCKDECDQGFYGPDCVYKCSENCEICDHEDGVCQCQPGYQTPDCTIKCHNSTYGENCQSNCSIHCVGVDRLCHHINGSCDEGCEPGYILPLCDTACPDGFYGQDCIKNCSDHCSGGSANCYHEDGSCVDGCKVGYEPPNCFDECPSGTYGVDCSQTCPNCIDQGCSHEDGFCESGCVDGWTGSVCAQVAEGGGGNTIVIPVIVAAVGVVLVAAIIGVIVWRRRAGKRSNQDPQPTRQSSFTSTRRDKNGHDNYISSDENTAVPLESLKSYVIRHAKDSKFSDQFQSVPLELSLASLDGKLEHNVKKNRYKNILPYDAMRVKLRIDIQKSQGDYINASYIMGNGNTAKFIASQGPNDSMQNDFIRMIWEQNIDRIVMLTNLVEQGKRKCNQYWPVQGEESFGDISVKLLKTDVYAEYTVRHLQISENMMRPKEVTQFHYLAWPDKMVPESPWGIIDFYQRVMESEGSGPLLVHCSAGVGRTGTFIGLCQLLEDAQLTGKMDFLTTLWRLRNARMHLVQTADQYKFLHRAAFVGHLITGTSIPVRDMEHRLKDLMASGRVAREFQMLSETSMDELEGVEKKSEEEEQEEELYQNSALVLNKAKNRLSNILPKDGYKVSVIDDAVSGDIYINAVLVPSFRKVGQGILTQLPLPSTVSDFWKMVIQYHVGLIAAFEVDQRHTDETIGVFLPSSADSSLVAGDIDIKMKVKEDSSMWQELNLTARKKNSDGKKWDKPAKITCLQVKNFELNSAVFHQILQKMKSVQIVAGSCTLFTCRNGATLSGLACVQSILLDKMKEEQRLAVPIVVGAIKAIRPQVIPTLDQYKLLYEVLHREHNYAAADAYTEVGDTTKSSLTASKKRKRGPPPPPDDLYGNVADTAAADTSATKAPSLQVLNNIYNNSSPAPHTTTASVHPAEFGSDSVRGSNKQKASPTVIKVPPLPPPYDPSNEYGNMKDLNLSAVASMPSSSDVDVEAGNLSNLESASRPPKVAPKQRRSETRLGIDNSLSVVNARPGLRASAPTFHRGLSGRGADSQKGLDDESEMSADVDTDGIRL